MAVGRPKTIILDIDGTLLEHRGDITTQHLHCTSMRDVNDKGILLPGSLDKLKEWDLKGYKIILLTGRRESTRAATEEQLSRLGVIYDQLVMGCSGGVRVLVNDMKPDGSTTAEAINIPRNVGVEGVNV